MKRYILNCTEEDRAGLEDLIGRKRISRQKALRAQILLMADEQQPDEQIAEELGVGIATVERVRKRAVLEGIEVALNGKQRATPAIPPKLDGRAEAHLVTLVCSEPPNGAPRWTLALLADRMVELRIVDTVSLTTIHRALKKTTSSRGR